MRDRENNNPDGPFKGAVVVLAPVIFSAFRVLNLTWDFG